MMIRFTRLRNMRRFGTLPLIFLFIAFFDEYVFGLLETAMPLIRDDYGMTYAQVGMLMGIPYIVSVVFELFFGVMADIGYRRRLLIGGGIFFIGALIDVIVGSSFPVLLLAFIVFHPASGAFVGLSQATWMDIDPERREINMTWWAFAGSVGWVIAPILFTLVVSAGGNWRTLFVICIIGAAGAWWGLFRKRNTIREGVIETEEDDESGDGDPVPGNFRAILSALRVALGELRRWRILRWLILLQFSDLMTDVLFGYLALYYVDVVGVDAATAGVAVSVWTGIGLIGDLLLVRLLERVEGLRYLRVSAAITFILFPAFLLVPGWIPKLVLLGILGLLNAGWYSVLSAQFYAALPGRSGTVFTLQALFGIFSGTIPLLVGAAAGAFGLGAAMWLLQLGPAALLVGIPRGSSSGATDENLNDAEV